MSPRGRGRGRAGTADAMASRGCCCRGRRVGAVAAGATPPCQRHNPHRLTGRDPYGSRPVFYLAVCWMKMHAGLMTCEARAAARFGTIGPPQDHCEPNANRLSAARRGVRVLSKRRREYPVLWGGGADDPPQAASRAVWSAAASILCGAWAPQAVFCAVIKCRILIICGNPLPQKMMCAAYRVGHL